ncbi:DUF3575 domain-containing protein [Chondrinema litorale]|uniref:DUF3575 domain-containing protein n=1 Tax=Chondrinema litorale TaxID=2994555 RepID=UPI002542C1F8|nr:DUF3575 domain-containing protein [Chondrinema litorale]UZR98111.1 DUF3575 domain-containing protein [Chondrinema litorale]
MKILLTIIICAISLIANAQESSVEKATLGVQAGLLGIWVNGESKLAEQFTLRTEVGVMFDSFGFTSNSDIYTITPELTLEPRWYYNIEKRALSGKPTSKNSANYFSIETSYHPYWFMITDGDHNYKREEKTNVTIVPTWGIRRSISENFNFEAGIGIGYKHYTGLGNDSNLATNIHLRIGYILK